MVSIEKLTLKKMILDESYHSLSTGLSQLPVPDKIKIGKKIVDVPKSLDEFSSNICYGQRLFLSEQEDNDFGHIIRRMDGYFYPLINNCNWNQNKALLFGKNILTLPVVYLYPIAMQIGKLMAELIEREQRMIHREASTEEKAAGIDKLSVYSELSALIFLMDSFKKTEEEVMLLPYNDCLVRFSYAKEQGLFAERLTEVLKNKKK